MRVALVSTPFIRVPPNGYGGTELFCYDLAEALLARGHAVTLFTTGDSETNARKRALYQVAHWPPTAPDEANHVAWAFAEAAREPFDVVHLNSPLGLPMSRFVDRPVVYTIHHIHEDPVGRLFSAHPWVTYVGISRRQIELEVPLLHSAVVHHAVRADRYPVELVDRGYLLHLGRYAHEKGTHLAVDVAQQAGLPIRLAGRVNPGEEEFFDRWMRPRLSRPGVAELGEAGPSQKLDLLRGARALVMPLLWEEPFGLVAIEAMLCGTPVLGFPRGSFPELIEQGVTGFLGPDVDALARFAAGLDGFDRSRCARRARELFGVERMAAGYERVYEQAVERGRAERNRAA